MVWYVIGAIVIIAVIIYIVKKKDSNVQQTNPLEKYLNQEAIVTETISDTLGTGKVKIDGKEIVARKGGPGIISTGKKVKIVEVQGSMFKVEPLE